MHLNALEREGDYYSSLFFGLSLVNSREDLNTVFKLGDDRRGDMSILKWYVIKTHPLQEEKAYRNLLMQGIEVYYPKILKRFWRKGKKMELLKPLFPGYLFAKFSIDTHYRKVSYTRGVSRIVAFGNFPIPLEDEEIEIIKKREENGIIKLEDRNFSGGDEIKVVRGPFNGLEGVFVRTLDDSERVEVLLRFLYTKAKIVLDKDFIEKKK